MIPNSCRRRKEILDYKGWSQAAGVGRRVVGMDDPYQLGLWLKENWNFILLIGVVGGSKFFTKSGVRSDVGCLPFVYHLVLNLLPLQRHSGSSRVSLRITLDNPKYFPESMDGSIWQLRRPFFSFFKFSPTIDCNTNYLLFASQSLTATMTLTYKYFGSSKVLPVSWLRGWLYYQYIYQPVFQSYFT